MSKVDFGKILLPTYIINLNERKDRFEHIQKEFENKSEFDLVFIEACKHDIGAFGLWESLRKCIQLAIENDEDFVIVCEDDHAFTEHYERDSLISNIIDAHEQNCDILSGGIGGFNNAIPLSNNRFWIDSFWCTQFIVIYRKFFKKILEESFKYTDTADGKFSEMTSNKMVLYPFISIQKDFGYSDVTLSNNLQNGLITQHFRNAAKHLEIYKNVYERFITKTDKSNKELFPLNQSTASPYFHDRLVLRDDDANEILPYIQHILDPKSIVEFGCGLGNFLHVAKKLGIKDILGLDGKWVELQSLRIDITEFRYVDFDTPFDLKKRYDLAICMEMAEHLKKESADILVKSLVDASDVILFSAAIPKQNEQSHVNEQWSDYWIEKFIKHNYIFYDVLRRHFWTNKNIFWWYRQNMFLVINEEVQHEFKREAILDLIHPEHYLQKINQARALK